MCATCNAASRLLTCASEYSTPLTALQANGRVKAAEFSKDHKPDDPAEKRRILAKGGRVFAIKYEDGIEGPPRVWLGNIDIPGIAMSRSLGDKVAHQAGCISDPDFTEFTLTAELEVVIMATDGLWEFLSNEEVVKIWEDNRKDPTIAMKAMIAESGE